MKTRFVKTANKIILDKALRPSSKRVYVALLSCQSNGQVRRTFEDLSKSSKCSVGTVQRAVAALEAAGYISVQSNSRFSEGLQAVLKDTNIYIIAPQDYSEGYTMVPCKLLGLPVTHSAFLVALYLLKLIGMKKRAWPSLRKGFMKHLGLSRATICNAIRQLVACNALVRLRCVMANRACSCNSYIMLLWGEKQASTIVPNTSLPLSSPADGGLIFDKHPVMQKITDWLLPAEKKVLDLCTLFVDYTVLWRQKGRPPFEDTS